MRDNQLIKIFRPIIIDGLRDLFGWPNCSVIQSFQPHQQGASTKPTVYFYKVMDHRVGGALWKDTYNEDTEKFDHVEIQTYETTFQINAMITEDPANVDQITPSDIINSVAQILQSYKTIQTLKSHDVQILKISDIRNPYFSDDRGRFEAVPSFDFILISKFSSASEVPVINSSQYGIFPV